MSGGFNLENCVKYGADITIASGSGDFALDVLPNEIHFVLAPVDSDGVIVPYDDKPFPTMAMTDDGNEGVMLNDDRHELDPGESETLVFAGHEIKVTANDKVGITLNGKPATPYSRNIEKIRYSIS